MFIDCFSRSWNFAVIIIFVAISSDSLVLPAVFELLIAVSLFVFGVHTGKWIDGTDRLTAVNVTLVGQNTALIVCGLLLRQLPLNDAAEETIIDYRYIVPVWLLSSFAAVNCSMNKVIGWWSCPPGHTLG